jgi:integrase/recombinase XerD
MTVQDLQIRLDAYLALREALGIHTKPIKLQLHSFVRYLELHAGGEPIRACLAIDWACTGPTMSGKSTRLSLARGFLRYLKASFPETEIPGSNLIAVPRRTTSYSTLVSLTFCAKLRFNVLSDIN